MPADHIGHRAFYVRGCRCDLCREANTIYGRQYRDERRIRKLTELDSYDPLDGLLDVLERLRTL